MTVERVICVGDRFYGAGDVVLRVVDIDVRRNGTQVILRSTMSGTDITMSIERVRKMERVR